MRWLLWKDYRHNRLIVFAALALLLGPYVVGLGVIVGGRWVKVEGTGVYWSSQWNKILLLSSICSLIASQLALPLIGGNAISGERADRSSEFLYSLPIARRRILASKLLLALAITAVVWLVNATVFWRLWGTPMRDGYHELIPGAMDIAITGLVFFCVAWFLSSFIPSPALGACGGFIAPILVGSGIALVDWLLRSGGWLQLAIDGWTFAFWYWGICLTLAPVCFAVGTWHYLRCLEP
jgi:ABC-type transport system involved in multi-copper enzyme maturation permease subunit